MTTIHHDNGAAFGRRTKFFRDNPTTGGIEWIYGADFAGGSCNWITYHPGNGSSVSGMIEKGMFLSRLD